MQARRSNIVKLLHLLPFSVSVSRETNIKKALRYLSILLQELPSCSPLRYFFLSVNIKGGTLLVYEIKTRIISVEVV